MIDDSYKEITVRHIRLIRQHPYADLTAGSRAALAFYEVLQALTSLEAKAPVLRAALITLAHRIRNESVTGNERIIREIIEFSSSDESGHEKGVARQPLPILKRIQILRELDNLQDTVHAMPYEIDILDPSGSR